MGGFPSPDHLLEIVRVPPSIGGKAMRTWNLVIFSLSLGFLMSLTSAQAQSRTDRPTGRPIGRD